MNCHLAHSQLCCDGSPYPPTQEDIDKVMYKYDIILNETQSKSDYSTSIKHIKNGLILIMIKVSRNTVANVYFFEKDDKGTNACAIHGNALNNNIDYILLRPKGYMMYPIDIVHLTDGNDFIFGTDIETTIDIAYQPDG